jgi:hypothetical protein
MKNSILLFAAVITFTFTSCKEKTNEESTDTVVIEKTSETQVVTPDTTAADGTTINVNKDGVEFSSKDGDKKTAVEVNENGGTVTTKK